MKPGVRWQPRMTSTLTVVVQGVEFDAGASHGAGAAQGSQEELDSGAECGFEPHSAPCQQCDLPRGIFSLSLL